MKTLFIIRGLPGSGKSSLGEKIAPKRSFSADDWFETSARAKNKTYSEVFDPSDLAYAHQRCQERVQAAMTRNFSDVAVCNTFSEQWEVEPYIKICRENGWDTFVIECQNTFVSVHNVPKESVEAMKSRWMPIHIEI
jgi:predicted ABC-type ATPase